MDKHVRIFGGHHLLRYTYIQILKACGVLIISKLQKKNATCDSRFMFLETSSCATCPYNHFCCGSKDSSCDAKSKFQKARTTRTSEQKRCIPKTTQKGVSLLCDRHPNCGLPCSLDEYCGKDGAKDDDECPGYYCGNYSKFFSNWKLYTYLQYFLRVNRSYLPRVT